MRVVVKGSEEAVMGLEGEEKGLVAVEKEAF